MRKEKWLAVEDTINLIDDHVEIRNCCAEYVCKKLNEKNQRIAELEEQLKNAIVPKFKLDQNVYRVYQDNIESGMICAYVIDDCGITYHLTFNKSKYCETYCYVNENDLFTTKEEAQAKLEELKGE